MDMVSTSNNVLLQKRDPEMRERIKEAASRLLITNGYRGLRFSDIAAEVKTTRANIHHHFGKKSDLIDEVIEEYYRETLSAMENVWLSDSTYRDKVLSTFQLNRRRYLLFNPAEESGGAPWSLISRMRLDVALLSEKSSILVRGFSKEMERCVMSAIIQAQANGEISSQAPANDIAVQIVTIIDSAAPITQDAGAFTRLEHLYLAHMRVILHAYSS